MSRPVNPIPARDCKKFAPGRELESFESSLYRVLGFPRVSERAAYLIDCDLYGNDCANLVLCCSIILLAERHDIDTLQ